jgi:mono/diheme cytochrome c family protein
MNKLAIQFIVVLVFIALTLVVYDNSRADNQTNPLAVQAPATEAMVVGVEHEGAHKESESASPHAEQQEDHALPEAVHAHEGDASGEPMTGDHGVPAAAAAVKNPTFASDESISRGATIFSQSCAVCHGDIGKGDGPGAVGLNPKPADLHAGHVQGNSDGAMFWIISYGREGTVMPAWNTLLSEEQRWDVVNFLRTFQEE